MLRVITYRIAPLLLAARLLAGETIEFRAGLAALHVAKSTGRIDRVTDRTGRSLNRGAGGVYLFDGQTGKETFPQRARVAEIEPGSAVLSFVGDDPELTVKSNIRSDDMLCEWAVTVANHGTKLRMVEIRLGLPLKFAGEWQYWDGYDGDGIGGPTRRCTATSNLYACNAAPTAQRGTDPTAAPRSRIKWHRLGNVGVFPLNAVCGPDIGFAIGIVPHDPLSYYAGGVQPAQSPRESFYYAVKLVVDPGKVEQCRFIVLAFQPTYGYRKAMETYYRRFASTFRLRDGLDPRVLFPATGTYLSFHENLAKLGLTELWREHCRRYFIGWTWLYAPFQRAGDFWVDSDTFDFKYWRRPREDSPRGATEYQRRLVAANRAARVGCAIGYYVIPQQCHTELANVRYADSVLVGIDGRQRRRAKGGVLGWPVTTMFAMNNSFGRNCERELNQILRLAYVDGIAFDNAFAHEMHTGGGMAASQGRAFLDGRPYVLNHLAYFHLMSRVRSTRVSTPDGFAPAVFANGPYNIFCAQCTDAALIEYHPYPPANVSGRFAALRYLLGPYKPINFKVHGRTRPGHILDKRPPTRERVEIEMNLRLHSLLALFRWGAYPRVREALGCADIIDALPVLIRLNRAGWQPVPAVKRGEGLWIERFGSGQDTFLVVINPTERPFGGVLEFDHKEAGLPPSVFERVYGGGALSSFVRERRSLLRMTIPPVWLQVLRVKSGAMRDQNMVYLADSRQTVRVLLDERAIQGLPYIRHGKLGIAFISPDTLMKTTRALARQIRAYFTYWLLAERFEKWFQTNGRTPVPDPSIVEPAPIVSSAAAAGRRVVIAFVLDPHASTPVIQGVRSEKVELVAATPDGFRAATSAFLRVLDKRFARFGYDGLFNQSPTQPGQLAPDSDLFRRHGWREFLMLMRRRH